MAEAASLPTIEEEEIGEDFYDQIQAPKFVDFTAPEIRPSHEDRYWFCFRVGCDQNHGEELDSEAIYKNFVLRVMAARSPNVRLRKALNKREASANLKCPLTAPAKSSKSRVPRLALISSMSENMVDNKPLSKKSSNLEQFRTVQSKKAMNLDVPKNRVIAKTLFRGREVKSRVFDSLNQGVGHLKDAQNRLVQRRSTVKMKVNSLRTMKRKMLQSLMRTGKEFICVNIYHENTMKTHKGTSRIETGHFLDCDLILAFAYNNIYIIHLTKILMIMTLKQKPTSNATGSQVVKYRKLKPTNPKPFKLRTDERGILKEANLEKKPLSPLKETTAKGGKALRKHHQKNDQDTENNSCKNRLGHATQEDQSKHIDLAERLKQRDKAAQKLDDKFKRKSQMMQPKLVRPKGALSRKKENGVLATPGKQQLSVIDEKSSNISQHKEEEAAKAYNNGASPTTKANGVLATPGKQQLSVIDEKSSNISQHKEEEAAKAYNNGASPTTKANGVLATPGKQQLSVIDEKSSNISQHKEEEAAKAYNNGASPTTKAISQPREEAAAKAYNSGASPTTKACGASSCSSHLIHGLGKFEVQVVFVGVLVVTV
ncbi:protein split ends-like isoform X1 [Senna tora]|uniref:Protein split ends-like isoform X1 n=1 Tax=Senna tora TaxID=362788 RepID=A0A834XCN9_9FABA|nr:protein split ends-like isoform X1 [Senna tora]